ncbi:MULTISPECIES: maltose alpha-D-glucosyltransferase [Micrococcaceae]|uniref:Maltose alpha-D-glucosyltransferase n=1 Tax=Paenarthrobacter aromaticivorans TaxID=2849150 RepID=A0ABS6I0X4_9MICC|nr:MULTISPECIES: maltose alpha-D-glucosyltransferase [Micrococcaceae]MBU8864684.1 maltose alpha-D-glucosyltransferase [Paenarthrobacter sp. MMS21-TAE1-1]BCW04671.1 trehalose synthase [Arthrobacter sp. NtRootA1]
MSFSPQNPSQYFTPKNTFELNAPGLQHDPHWYRKAVFYEVLVRAFADANGDGSGDFHGLIEKLDYLQWLGVDCLWLPPFFHSPLRDGGYDIADYTSVLDEFGTISDFKRLVAEAHARGVRVIIDLPLNHTSDQHPWFQESRKDPTGPYGDFYVWSDTDEKYQDARIIFVDTEESNWTFDPIRRQFFWHRFFSHQPDLNFENPKVIEALYDVIRFWLDQGIDGFRADAVPYLFEEEGTNCENLPATHAFLQDLRRMVDANYPGRVIIAEANQPPHEVVEYFGTEEAPECHMAFHFPIMPRLYYALRDQKAAPIIQTLRETPEIPKGAQWGTFLRNHDELTLEMVSADDRAAMLGWYAPDPRMRANIGIRRRLAPLLDNSRAEIELINALLLSLPGSPFLYYGDEIGMGDNIWLDDRDAVRTPMQWNPDRNAGFSGADPGKLYLPVIQSLVYNYSMANVEAEAAHSGSLLRWTRQILSVRKNHPVFGLGSFRHIEADNEVVLAYVRELPAGNPEGEDAETILCVFNLSQHPVAAILDLPEYAGRGFRDIFGGQTFPAVGDNGQLTVMLGSHNFYWLRLRSAFSNPSSPFTQAIPVVSTKG